MLRPSDRYDSTVGGSEVDRAVDEAVETADLRVLLMALHHVSGDERWLEAPFTPRRDVRIIADESAGMSDAVAAEIRGVDLTRPFDDATRRATALTPLAVNPDVGDALRKAQATDTVKEIDSKTMKERFLKHSLKAVTKGGCCSAWVKCFSR